MNRKKREKRKKIDISAGSWKRKESNLTELDLTQLCMTFFANCVDDSRLPWPKKKKAKWECVALLIGTLEHFYRHRHQITHHDDESKCKRRWN
jgi:hypothetical protein